MNILPFWAQFVARILPMSYIFEQGRNYIFNGEVDFKQVLISYGLNILYLILTSIFLRASFKKTLDKGLVKVY